MLEKMKHRNFALRPRRLTAILEDPETPRENCKHIIAETSVNSLDSCKNLGFTDQGCGRIIEQERRQQLEEAQHRGKDRVVHESQIQLMKLGHPTYWNDKGSALGFVTASNKVCPSEQGCKQNFSTPEMENFFPEFGKYKEIATPLIAPKCLGAKAFKAIKQGNGAKSEKIANEEDSLVQSWLTMFGGSHDGMNN